MSDDEAFTEWLEESNDDEDFISNVRKLLEVAANMADALEGCTHLQCIGSPANFVAVCDCPRCKTLREYRCIT